MRLLSLLLLAGVAIAQERPRVTLENSASKLVLDLAGGALTDFQFKDQGLNPFTWEERGSAAAPRMRGHFLCLDRWGAPSAAELKNGMPFHGEAPRVMWKVTARKPTEVEMEARLPIAGIEVRRVVRLADSAAVALVTETVTNTNPLGRVYNMVQHPTIGPPFLDETTVVDANARKGFMQSSPLPNPEEPAVWWPQALKESQAVDMRRLQDDPLPAVVSYTIDEAIGWTTAANARRGLLLGYLWKTAEYPWFNAWRHVEAGKPFARGLEFGTTGLHQPFPVLIEKGRIFGRPIFVHLDAGQAQTRVYAVFLMKVLQGYAGAAKVEHRKGRLVVSGRGPGELALETGGLLEGVF